MHKSLFIAAGGFDPRISIGEDWEFFFRCSLLTRIGCVQQPLVYYRRHPESVGYKNKRQLQDRLLAGEKIFSHPELPADCKKFRRGTVADTYLNESTGYIRQLHVVEACRYFLLGCTQSPSSAVRWVKDVFRGLYFRVKRFANAKD
jgi:hypothetical protein